MFTYQRYYFNNSVYIIKVLTDYNNLKGFINIKKLSFKQAKQALDLTAYNFKINYKPKKTNLTDILLQRLNYKNNSNNLK